MSQARHASLPPIFVGQSQGSIIELGNTDYPGRRRGNSYQQALKSLPQFVFLAKSSF